MERMMKPILMNTEMVRAVLDGRKTVTRRVIKPQPCAKMPDNHNICRMPLWTNAGLKSLWYMDVLEQYPFRQTRYFEKIAPHEPGDILYVREKWRIVDYLDGLSLKFEYEADGKISDFIDFTNDRLKKFLKYISRKGWCPGIFMPKEAARLFLRVTGVRVERLQDITVEGILAEGMDVEMPLICKQSIDPNFPFDNQRDQWNKMSDAQREEYVANMARRTYIGWCDYADRLFNFFKTFWDSTIKPKDRAPYGWEANPYVWVVEFERISREEAGNA